MRGGEYGIAIAAEMIGAVLVCHDEEKIVGWHKAYPLAVRQSTTRAAGVEYDRRYYDKKPGVGQAQAVLM
jgi:hypothetical protein